jgi:hypothetical protein
LDTPFNVLMDLYFENSGRKPETGSREKSTSAGSSKLDFGLCFHYLLLPTRQHGSDRGRFSVTRNIPSFGLLFSPSVGLPGVYPTSQFLQ